MYINNFETFISKCKHELKKENFEFLQRKVYSYNKKSKKYRLIEPHSILRMENVIEHKEDILFIIFKDEEDKKDSLKKIKEWSC